MEANSTTPALFTRSVTGPNTDSVSAHGQPPRLGVGHVEVHVDGGVPEGVGQVLALGVEDVGHDDPRALRDEGPRDRGADPARTPGDDGHPAGQAAD